MIHPYIKHRSLVNLHLALPQRNELWRNYNARQTNQFNLVLNPSKLTKYVFLSSSKLSSYHELDNTDIDLRVVSSAKLCGIHIDHLLKWEENLKQVEEFLPFYIRKQLVQALVSSKFYCNCLVYHNLPHYIVKCHQIIQTARARFVIGKLVEREDIIKLNWLPVKEHIEWQLLKSVHKAIFSHETGQVTCDWSNLSTIELLGLVQLCSLFKISLVSCIYQAAKSFNTLRKYIRNCIDFNQFSKMTFKYLMKKVKDNL